MSEHNHDHSHDHEHGDLDPVEVAVVVGEADGEDGGPWAKRLSLTIAAAEVNKCFDKISDELSRQVRLPGFRPGRVPRALLEKRLGDGLVAEAAKNLVARGMHSALEREKLDAIGTPKPCVGELKPARGQDFSFAVDIELRPTFELPEWKGLPVEQEEAELLPEELDAALRQLCERKATYEEVSADHVLDAKESYQVNGKGRYLIDGQEIYAEDQVGWGLTAGGGKVLGARSNDLISDFLMGAKVGDKRSCELELSAYFPVEAHRGKKAVVEVEITSIKRRVVPEFNDELAKKVGLGTADELRETIRTNLLESLIERIKSEVRSSLLDRLVSSTAFELPKRLARTVAAEYAQQGEQYALSMGFDAKAIPDELAKTMDDSYRQESEKQLRRSLFLRAFCEKENIRPSEEEVDAEVVRQAKEANQRAADVLQQLYANAAAYENFVTRMANEKALEMVVEHANVKIVPRKKAEPKAAEADPPAANANPVAQ
jgi:trigger factor